ncbi:MAG: site-specific DNA-methyltransferase [Planctomycetaceae bacterium]|jgi:adenine-specific DNA-methyltransferase|nr:site-specific DNA-methyltransferase [Planctomycetaceae bacterium]
MPILSWLSREDDLKCANQTPYRLLEELPKLSYGDKNAGNMIIQGDNLEALKALLPFYAGQVKCVYIDPPYNTGSAFEHYDDNLEHSQWLSMMYPRLELLKDFLRSDGFICCHINDDEGSYLKVIMDEIFGRQNFLTTIFVQVRYAEKTLKQDMNFHKQIEQIYIYRNSYNAKPILNTIESSFDKFIFYFEEKAGGTEIILGGKRVVIFQANEYKITEKTGSENGRKEIWASGTILDGNSSGRFFRDYLTGRYETDGLGVLYKVYGIGDDKFDFRYFTGPKKIGATKGKYYQGVPLEQINNPDELKTLPIENFLDLAAAFGNCRTEGGVGFRAGKKPEALLKFILGHFSNEGDLVLDSFSGSGSTCATAHKMKRKYIGIEMGEHAQTHCVVRLKKVIDGEQGGISESVGWQGGGGFHFFQLGEGVFDSEGRINETIKFCQLAAYLWFYETKMPFNKPKQKTPFLGVHNGTGYALLYNGILHDRRINGGNVLTTPMLEIIISDADNVQYDSLVVYGEYSCIGEKCLKADKIIFKQIPYDLKVK